MLVFNLSAFSYARSLTSCAGTQLLTDNMRTNDMPKNQPVRRESYQNGTRRDSLTLRCASTLSQLDEQRNHGSYSLLVVGIFKLEKSVLYQWVSHYIAEGVDHFLLVDNNKEGNGFSEACEIDVFIRAGIVTMIKNSSIALQRDLPAIAQPFISRSKWVMHPDLDEFVYSRERGSNPSNSIAEYLSKVPDSISSIAIPWKLFSTSSRASNSNDVNVGVFRGVAGTNVRHKWVARGLDLVSFGPHAPRIRGFGAFSKSRFKNPSRTCSQSLPDFECIGIASNSTPTEESLERHSLHLNHYRLRSLESFAKSKIGRGDVFWAHEAAQNHRSWKFFAFHNSHNVILDDELKLKRFKRSIADERMKDVIICDYRHPGGIAPSWCSQNISLPKW